MKTKHQTTFSLDEETKNKLAEYAKVMRMSKSQALTQLIWQARPMYHAQNTNATLQEGIQQ